VIEVIENEDAVEEDKKGEGCKTDAS